MFIFWRPPPSLKSLRTKQVESFQFSVHDNMFYFELRKFPFSIFPLDSRFTQQELPACKPILTPRWVRILSHFFIHMLILQLFKRDLGPMNYPFHLQVISAFMLVSIVFIPIGLVSLFASRDVCLQLNEHLCIFIIFIPLYLNILLPYFIRLLKLLIGMKLPAYQQPREAIKLAIYKPLGIKLATEPWGYVFSASDYIFTINT